MDKFERQAKASARVQQLGLFKDSKAQKNLKAEMQQKGRRVANLNELLRQSKKTAITATGARKAITAHNKNVRKNLITGVSKMKGTALMNAVKNKNLTGAARAATNAGRKTKRSLLFTSGMAYARTAGMAYPRTAGHRGRGCGCR